MKQTRNTDDLARKSVKDTNDILMAVKLNALETAVKTINKEKYPGKSYWSHVMAGYNKIGGKIAFVKTAPEKLDSCVEKVKKQRVADGLEAKEAESSAYAICKSSVEGINKVTSILKQASQAEQDKHEALASVLDQVADTVNQEKNLAVKMLPEIERMAVIDLEKLGAHQDIIEDYKRGDSEMRTLKYAIRLVCSYCGNRGIIASLKLANAFDKEKKHDWSLMIDKAIKECTQKEALVIADDRTDGTLPTKKVKKDGEPEEIKKEETVIEEDPNECTGISSLMSQGV